VLLIGTAHGHTLSDVLRNGVIAPLVGGVTSVTLGDKEAKRANRGNKVRADACTGMSVVALAAECSALCAGGMQ
jgi:stage III sporulation protein SpoIIIAA